MKFLPLTELENLLLHHWKKKKIRTGEAFTRYPHGPLRVRGVRRRDPQELVPDRPGCPPGKRESRLVRAGFGSCSKVKSKWPNLN